MCLVWLTLAFVPPYPVFVAAFALSAFLSATVNPLLQTIRQERVPPELRGRVFGTVLSLVLVASPVGLLVGGLVAEVGGLEAGFALAFVLYSAITLAAALNPVLREMDLRRERADVVESPAEQVLAEVEEPGPQAGTVDLALPASRARQAFERPDEDGELEVHLRDPGG
jgi:MFS family permease